MTISNPYLENLAIGLHDNNSIELLSLSEN